eukprot:15353473-Ditylum_brightwellii.AAC.1
MAVIGRCRKVSWFSMRYSPSEAIIKVTSAVKSCAPGGRFRTPSGWSRLPAQEMIGLLFQDDNILALLKGIEHPFLVPMQCRILLGIMKSLGVKVPGTYIFGLYSYLSAPA